MALRDRQIVGFGFEKATGFIIALFFTACVPILGYNIWYPLLNHWVGLPKELWPLLATVSTIIHLTMSAEYVPNNFERNLQFNGSYTGYSFPSGLCLVPRAPIPVILLLVRIFGGEEIYRNFLWSLKGDVSIKSILAQLYVEGLSLDNYRIAVSGPVRLEVTSAATFLSQSVEGQKEVIDLALAKYSVFVKTNVIGKHTAENLSRGEHSDGMVGLEEWMVDKRDLNDTFGIRVEDGSLVQAKILSERMEKVFDANVGKRQIRAVSNEYALAFAEFKETLPKGVSFEVAANMFNASRLDEGLPPVSLNVLQLK